MNTCTPFNFAIAVVCTLGCGSDAMDAADAGRSRTKAREAARSEAHDAGESSRGSEDDCKGFDVRGLKYSPGGSVLPDTCKPFDVLTNNQYAIRCIDAMPNFKTPFPGDEYCILPPPPDQGFQVGVHPGGNRGYWEKLWAGDYSLYRDPEVTGPYELPAGGEIVQNYDAAFEGPAEQRYFYRRQFRGRYGSHHGTADFSKKRVEVEGWQDNGDFMFTAAPLITVQNAHTDFPQSSLEIAPEEMGVGYPVSSSGVYLNLHHFNSTDKPLLRESWINVWYVPADEITKMAQSLTVLLEVNYPIGKVTSNAGSARATGETQVLSLYGHHHAWTTRFHAWIERTGAHDELIYDSYNFWDMPTFSYNSLVKNPTPGMEGLAGASSGPITLHTGDVIRFECRVDTTQKRADELGVELPSAPLRYGNQVFDAEMCLLMGQATGAPIGIAGGR